MLDPPPYAKRIFIVLSHGLSFFEKDSLNIWGMGWVGQNHPDLFPVSDSLGKEARNGKSQKGFT